MVFKKLSFISICIITILFAINIAFAANSTSDSSYLSTSDVSYNNITYNSSDPSKINSLSYNKVNDYNVSTDSYQGITGDGTYFYGSSTHNIYKYDQDFNIMCTNRDSDELNGGNHQGDQGSLLTK